MAITDGLLTYIKLDGSSVDSKAYATGITDTAVSYIAGKIGQCASFNGSTSKIQGTATFPTGSADRSVAFWFYRSGTTGRIFQYGNSALNQMFCAFLSGGQIGISQYGMSSSFVNLSADTWHLILMTYSGSTASMYIDGNNTAAISRSYSFGTSGTGFSLMCGTDNREFTNGRLNHCGVWNRVLTGAENTYLWNSGAGIDLSFIQFGTATQTLRDRDRTTLGNFANISSALPPAP